MSMRGTLFLKRGLGLGLHLFVNSLNDFVYCELSAKDRLSIEVKLMKHKRFDRILRIFKG